MKINHGTSAESAKLAKSFESLCNRLRHPHYADRLEKPLAYWALTNDRRLPWAFLGRTLGDLLNTSYAELLATPSIGLKKIGSLLELMTRATQGNSKPDTGGAHVAEAQSPRPSETLHPPSRFDPALVSETLWTQWRDTVRRHGMGHERLGRLTASLRSMPTVVWQTPLSDYLNHSLGEVRRFKTHGEKRVRVILEVFSTAHEMLLHVPTPKHLCVRLVPRFVPPIEQWLALALSRNEVPAPEEVREGLTAPLVRQLHVDLRPNVARLAEERLGVNAMPQSVRQQAGTVGLTRARVYQLLEECAKAMQVRWPEGRFLLAAMTEKFKAPALVSDVDWSLFRATTDLFYPRKPLRPNDD